MRPFVDDHRVPGRRRPGPGVPSFERLGLDAGLRVGAGSECAVVEEDGHRFDVVLVANLEEFVERPDEMFRVLGIDGILHHDAGAVQSDLFGQGEFTVHHLGRETRAVPHGRVVDRVGRNVVEAAEPRIHGGPLSGLLFGPSFGCSGLGTECRGKQCGGQQKGGFLHHGSMF